MSALAEAASTAGRLARPLRYNVSLRLGAALLVALILFGFVGAFALPDPNDQNLNEAYAPPGSFEHLLGADALGRDILAWVSHGVLTGLAVSASVVLLSAFVGVVIGLAAGYMGGLADGLLMRLVDLQLAIPPLLLFIAASAVVGNEFWTLVLLLSVVGWVPYARIVRSEVLAERERSYVAAARLAGAPLPRVLFVHLLPATATLIFVLASLQAGLVLLWESGLSFLGLGLQPPTASLGFMISQGRSDLVEAWWIVTFPGLAIVLLVLAFNLLGDGLRDAFHLDVNILGR
jgi:peptide/nickel transport system permease protein